MTAPLSLESIVAWCDERTRRPEIRDFPGSHNGLQLQNRTGQVNRIGWAVDADQEAFSAAAAAGVDFLIVHHGLFWEGSAPWTGRHFKRLQFCLDHNIAVYSSHLPLDCHPEIGNNALLARHLGLAVEKGFLPYEGTSIGLVLTGGPTVEELTRALGRLTGRRVDSITAGPKRTRRIGMLTGSGTSALPYLEAEGIDTFITGELKQHAYSFAREAGINLLLAGHYHTETFGVEALAMEAAENFGLQFSALRTGCIL
jgi:dinuclear metal center YbgI/SA1388 family protein